MGCGPLRHREGATILARGWSGALRGVLSTASDQGGSGSSGKATVSPRGEGSGLCVMTDPVGLAGEAERVASTNQCRVDGWTSGVVINAAQKCWQPGGTLFRSTRGPLLPNPGKRNDPRRRHVGGVSKRQIGGKRARQMCMWPCKPGVERGAVRNMSRRAAGVGTSRPTREWKSCPAARGDEGEEALGDLWAGRCCGDENRREIHTAEVDCAEGAERRKQINEQGTK